MTNELVRATPKPRRQPGAKALEAFAVVLVRPQEEGNVGAVARAAVNMGLSRLILVEPAVELGPVARARAVKAEWLLAGASRVTTLAEAVRPFQRVVGTTASRGRRHAEAPRTPRELVQEMATAPMAATALVFGPETSGLMLEELALCTHLVRIPSSPKLPTLNLSHAVQVLSYELYVALAATTPGRARGRSAEGFEPPAAVDQVEGLFEQLLPLLSAIGFERDESFGGVARDLRRLAAKSQLTEREVSILRGICRRAAAALKRSESGSTSRNV